MGRRSEVVARVEAQENRGEGGGLSVDDVVLGSVPLERLEDEITVWAGNIAAATARWLVWVAVYDRREGWRQWGARSCAQWLNWKCGMSLRNGREHVRVARCLEDLPLVRESFIEGRLSYSKVRELTRVAHGLNEQDLVDIALACTASQLQATCRGLSRAVSAADESHAAAVAFENRQIVKRRNHDGSTSIILTVPDESANAVWDRLCASADSSIDDFRSGGESNRSVVERMGGVAAVRADTAVGLLDGTFASEESAEVETLLVVDSDVLASASPDGPWAGTSMFGGFRVAPVVARRMACDARLQLAVENSVGDALGIGRTSTRVVSRRLRRLVMRRDKGMCRFPGCGASRRLHAHHVVHWAEGGPTVLDNLVMLCNFHHHVVHEGGWGVRHRGATSNAGGSFEFLLPDGRIATVGQLAGDPMKVKQVNDVGGLDGTAVPLGSMWCGDRFDVADTVWTVMLNEQVRFKRQLQPS